MNHYFKVPLPVPQFAGTFLARKAVLRISKGLTNG
jgi:hypothetical protein